MGVLQKMLRNYSRAATGGGRHTHIGLYTKATLIRTLTAAQFKANYHKIIVLKIIFGNYP